MVEETMAAWQVAQAAANKTEALADNAISTSFQAQPAKMSLAAIEGGARDLANQFLATLLDFNTPLFINAYAAEKNPATRWANEISKKFDSYPAGQQIRGLASDLGVDAKTAYKQLQMAQDILRGDAEREEGDLNSMVEKSNTGADSSSTPANSGDSKLGQPVRYTMTTTGEDGLTDTFDADITLHEDGTMEIAFTPHAVVCNDDFTFSVTDEPGMSQHLVGAYNDSTGEFVGMGDTGVEDNVWNYATTLIKFDMDAGTASGTMGDDLEGLAASAFRTQISLTRQ